MDLQERNLRPQALYEAIADSLREEILRHGLAPGTPIDESVLAGRYGVSRTPLREALKVLAKEGLVETKVRCGCSVTRLGRKDLEQILDALELLEDFALRQAAEQASQESAFLGEEAGFLDPLLALAGNRYLTSMVQSLREKLRLALGPDFDTLCGDPEATLRLSLWQALAAGRKDAALRLLARHAGERRRASLAHLAGNA